MTRPKRVYRSLDDVEAVVLGFESCTLPPSELDHGAHLTVALWYVSKLTDAEAVESIRAGLYRFLDCHGIEREKYNETITIFWIKRVRRFLDEANNNRSFVDIVNEAITLFGDSRLAFDYYSKEHLASEAAKGSWVEPDLKPLDF